MLRFERLCICWCIYLFFFSHAPPWKFLVWMDRSTANLLYLFGKWGKGREGDCCWIYFSIYFQDVVLKDENRHVDRPGSRSE